MSEHDRIPPHSLDAERHVLGACLVDAQMVSIIAQHVDAEAFYGHTHASIWSAITALSDAGEPCDTFAVVEELRRRDQLERVGGFPYVRSLLDAVDTASTAEFHAKIIREKATCRALIAAARRIETLGYQGESDPKAALDEAEETLRKVGLRSSGIDAGIAPATMARELYRELDEAVSASRPIAMRSPWPLLDAMTGGFYGGELVVWPAAAKMGKSSALNLVAHYTAAHDGMVLWFALEMGWRNTVRRMMATLSGIEARRLRGGDVRGVEWEHLSLAMHELQSLPMRIFNRPKTLSDLRRIAHRVAVSTPVRAIIVDHIGFLDDVVRGDRRVSKHERLDAAYTELLGLGEELNCVVHAVVHLNREGMKAEQPRLEHIRDGGNPEGHAHIIIAPFRPDPVGDPATGKFVVLANRDGRTGAIDMDFQGARGIWREPNRSLWFEAPSLEVA